ncbi:Leucine-rich repeat protein kinase family protein, putative isoform 1 [Hibiscus syriacus]|uniref:Leucine-rich repeat protein kinase family protein, putative isoform 1 n=1 Tax=Hibiscus syriacus TaxID=106335 RepID=A0A6A2XFS9_HIBSY|nr:protein DOG1-like 4 [Hibiscus syriacus]KAE8674248.1 Leucine-rich repeat protein kinase family protein, putative isoform 1 [Hibiscus syriacus]
MKSKVGERFSEFYDKWMCQLDVYLQQLLNVSKESTVSTLVSTEGDKQALVSKLTTHYKEYYTVKWAAAHEDVLAFYCPVWLSKLEDAYSWLTGWKPSTIFGLVESMRRTREPGPGLAELTEEQVRKIEQLRVKIKLEEEKVEGKMERQQVAMADRKKVELVRMARRMRNEELVAVAVAMKGVLAGMERVMKAADCVRLKTLKGVLDVLSPSQSLDFLAGTCMLQIQLRKWGQTRDSQKGLMVNPELHNNLIF